MRTATKQPKLPDTVQKYVGVIIGKPASGDRIPIDTPMHITQRPYKKQNVYKYIAKVGGLDWNLFGHVRAVRRRSDGALAVIDAQHRINLVKIIAPWIDEVPAHIIEVEDAEFETKGAEYFSGLNGGVTKSLTNEEFYYSEVLAKKPEALNMERVLKKCGLSCGRVNASPKTHPVVYANFQKCLKLSETATVRAVELMLNGYKGISDDPLHGLVFLLSHNEYRDLGDPTTANGKRFETWFTSIGQNGLVTLNDLKFRKYRANSQYQKGIAYGLCKNFNRYLKGRGHPQISTRTLKEIWESGFKEDDDSSYLT